MNDQLINDLEILVKYYKITKDHFRKMAYEKAIKTIRNLDFQIEDVKQIYNMKGIGKSILTKIEEYLDTNQIQKVEEVRPLLHPNKTPQEIAIEEFLHIWGVGEVKAKSLWNLGYRSMRDIRNSPHVLNRQQLIGLRYYEDLQKKIPRETITIIQVIIRFILDKEFGKNKYKLKVAGSYRRGKLFSNDIDILITSHFFDLNQIITILQKWKVITVILSLKTEKFMGIGNCPNGKDPYFRIDIEFLPEKEFSFGLLYFTGSKDFNREIRWYAKKNGYLLNQHGIKNVVTGEYINAKTEEDIFDILDLQYVDPKKRL